jgi:predicted nucleic acid-binding protein
LYLLDTSALLCLRDDEPGAQRVAALLAGSASGKSACLGCFMSLMELLNRVWKDEGEPAARLAYAQALTLPIEWVHETAALLERAAEVKARHALSVADAWIAAAAIEHACILVHKDPEFEQVAGIAQEALPYR